MVVCMTRIPEALSRVRDEQARTCAEQEAFEAFATRIQAMDAENTSAPPTPGHGRILTADSSTQTGIGMARVREAYQETVMATPHYPEDYDESLEVNVSEEFGPELATGLAQRDTLTPPLQQAIVEASQTAATERTTYQQTLEAEYDALQDAKRRLRTLTDTLTQVREQTNTPQEFPALLDTYDQVEELRIDCAAMIEDRQAALASRPQHERHHLHEYLYTNSEWTYPVLADALDCLNQIQTVEHELIQVITRQP